MKFLSCLMFAERLLKLQITIARVYKLHTYMPAAEAGYPL